MGYVVAKRKREHIQRVAETYGLSTIVVDAIIKAYIDDLCATLKSGVNVVIPHLVAIAVKPLEQGYQTKASVSKILRQELRHSNVSKCVNVIQDGVQDDVQDDVQATVHENTDEVQVCKGNITETESQKDKTENTAPKKFKVKLNIPGLVEDGV